MKLVALSCLLIASNAVFALNKEKESIEAAHNIDKLEKRIVTNDDSIQLLSALPPLNDSNKRPRPGI